MDISYRMGKPDDAYQIAELLHLASGGISNFLLNDILPNCEIIDLIALGVTDKAATISFSKTLVAESNKEIIGILNFYHVDEHKIPDIMTTFIPEERISHISDLFTNLVPDSIYLHALAVKQHIGKSSIGRTLIRKVGEYARTIGIEKLSAHVWCDNKRVLQTLLKGGFEVHSHIVLEKHPLLPERSEMMLLVSNVR